MDDTIRARYKENKHHFKNGFILAGAAVAFLIVSFLLVFYDVVLIRPRGIPESHVASYPDKIKYTLQCQTLLVVWLLFNVLATIYVRMRNISINPMEPEPEKLVLPMRAILINSLESVVISVLSQMIYITFASSENVLRYILYINLVQFIGRIAFMYGYPMKRAFGYFLTIWPNLILNIVNVYFFINLMFFYK